MLKPLGLTHGHYECRSLGDTLPVFTDLLAMKVMERENGQAIVQHPNTGWRLVVHEAGRSAPDKPHNNHYGVRVLDLFCRGERQREPVRRTQEFLAPLDRQHHEVPGRRRVLDVHR